MTGNAPHTHLGHLIWRHLAHDLHYRASSYVPNLDVRRPKSLLGVLKTFDSGDHNATADRWALMPFAAVMEEVKSALRAELERQLGTEPGFLPWCEQFVQCFDKVEYSVNLRLLHAFAQLTPEELHTLIGAILGVGLPGNTLQLRRPGSKTRKGPNWYHRAQDDGLLVGEQAMVALELKTQGKSSRTKLDAAQVAKHIWMLSQWDAPEILSTDRFPLVLLPDRDGEPTGYATDLALNGRHLCLRPPGNKPFKEFIQRQTPEIQSALMATVSSCSIPVSTYQDLATTASQVLKPSREQVTKQLAEVARLANPG